jgi:hypothetical protein
MLMAVIPSVLSSSDNKPTAREGLAGELSG